MEKHKLNVEMNVIDRWLLLNTSAAELEGLGTPSAVADLNTLLEVLRQIYRSKSSKCPAPIGLPATLRQTQKQSDQLRTIVEIGAKYDLFIIDGVPLKETSIDFDGTPISIEKPTDTRLFELLRKPLVELLNEIGNITATTVYVCEWCGKIGPSTQKSKRFCDGTCRKAAYREAQN